MLTLMFLIYSYKTRAVNEDLAGMALMTATFTALCEGFAICYLLDAKL